MLTLSALKSSDVPEPEYARGETYVYAKRGPFLHRFDISKGRERSTGRIYYCLRLADGFRTYDSLAGLKAAVRA